MRKGFKKQLNIRILVSALIISTLLFSAGLLVGYSISKEKLSLIEKKLEEIITDVQNFQLQFFFFDVLGGNATCPLLTSILSDINKRSYEIGRELISYGSKNVLKDYEEYINMKREYYRLLIGYWLLASKLKKLCKLNSTTIIYFFSKNCTSCDDQGFILTYLKHNLKDKVLIFALDADVNEPSIRVLKQYYNVNSYPTLIIDSKPYYGFKTKDELENIIHN